MIVYLNGDYIEHSNAKISVDDRGFLFADGVYEVVRVYEGRAFQMQAHMERMGYGLNELRIRDEVIAELPDIAEQLLDRNDLRSGDATIYIEVTRGAAPRAHAFPSPEVAPTVYVLAKGFKNHPEKYFVDGVAAVTVPDTRWSRCDIKSIALLPNVLANQQAKDAGAFEALFVRDDILIEGSHSNLFAVINGEAVTHPEGGYILGGITRKLILNRAAEAGVHAREEPIEISRFDDIQELFLSGTTTEVMPIVKLDDRMIGDGQPGPVTRQLQQAFKHWRSE